MKTVGRSIRCYNIFISICVEYNYKWEEQCTYLSEKLEQVPALIKIDEDVKVADGLKVLVKNQAGLLEPDLDVLVIRVRDLDEFNSACLEVGDVPNNIVGQECNVLHTGAVVVVHVFFDLGLLLADGGLVDGHFDNFVGRGHDDGLEGGVFTVIS